MSPIRQCAVQCMFSASFGVDCEPCFAAALSSLLSTVNNILLTVHNIIVYSTVIGDWTSS